MATFRYVAVGPDGTKVKAAGEADSANVLKNQLALRDFQVVKIREKKGLNIEITKERVPRQVIQHFSRQMAAFTRGGIPLTDALGVVAEGVDNKRFKAILLQVQEALHAGVTFSDALVGALVGVPAVLPRDPQRRPSTPAGSTRCSTSSPTT